MGKTSNKRTDRQTDERADRGDKYITFLALLADVIMIQDVKLERKTSKSTCAVHRYIDDQRLQAALQSSLSLYILYFKKSSHLETLCNFVKS